MLRAFRSSADEKVELPITPMLDMTFQLLAFLILTFKASTVQEGNLEFSLPAAGPKPAAIEKPYDISDPDLNDSVPVTVVVKTVRDGLNDGAISALIIQAEEGETLVPGLAALRHNLEARRREQGAKAQVRIAAEGRLKFGCVIDVLDACVQSGYQKVGFAPPPDLGLN